MTVEPGLIHLPVGVNVFVIKRVAQDVTFATIFREVMPFLLTDVPRRAILIAFPALAPWLPAPRSALVLVVFRSRVAACPRWTLVVPLPYQEIESVIAEIEQ